MPLYCEIAYAKINLALHVRRRRDDGYHELETLFVFAEDGDFLSVEPADHLSLKITGNFGQGLLEGSDNLVLRASKILADRNGISVGAAFTLDKRLPVAAGIGGGSADAAAALRLAARLWNIGLDGERPSDVAPELGADVPACVASQTCFGSGVGDRLLPVDGTDLVGLPLLLVNPRISCPTRQVFQYWDGIDRGALDLDNWRDGRNDLEASAVALHPEIAEVLAVLNDTKPTISRMSGSGATCFGLFQTTLERDIAEEAIASACPEWWTMSSCIR